MKKISSKDKLDYTDNGYHIIENVYSLEEVERIIKIIDKASKDKNTFQSKSDLYAIRQVFKEIPELFTSIFNANFIYIVQHFLGQNYFVVKSIYFDKPPLSNWHVLYHQDLTISVNPKKELDGFAPWTVKKDQFAVQPPLPILENINTIRIHLDDTDSNNGALNIIPTSHKLGIVTDRDIALKGKREISCSIRAGGIMLMKPLLFHNSNKTRNEKRRRIIHIEFSSIELPTELSWAERINLF